MSSVISRWYRRVGAKGGRRRARVLSPERRAEIAHVAGASAGRTHRAKRLGRLVRTIRRTRRVVKEQAG